MSSNCDSPVVLWFFLAITYLVQIISKLGTHYMTRATFGSLTRCSSVLDIRDDKIAKSFGEALRIHVGELDTPGSRSLGTSDSAVEKLLSILRTDPSSIRRAACSERQADYVLVDYEMRSIADLILDPARAQAIQRSIDQYMSRSHTTAQHKAQVMFHPLSGRLFTDQGSGARASTLR
jgi:hypothetical protein